MDRNIRIEEIKIAKEVALNFIKVLEEKQINYRLWNKIENFINLQYETEKSKSRLNCDKDALIKSINGQMW